MRSFLVKSSSLISKRSFHRSTVVYADEISKLYLNELKSFKPTATGLEAVSLPTTFPAPAAPAKPEFEDISLSSSASAIKATAAASSFVAPAPVESSYDAAVFESEEYAGLSEEDKKAKFEILTAYRNWKLKVDAKAEFDKTEVEREAKRDMFADLEWPELKNPIDDPNNYPDFLDIDTDNHPKRLFPKPLKEIDWDHHH